MAGEYGIPLPIRPDSVPPVPILTHSMRSDFGSVMADAACRGLLGEIAAVDDELGAGDERGFVGGEDPVGDLDRLADPWAFSPRALTPWGSGVGAILSARSPALVGPLSRDSTIGR
jgi:hypothetical protein